MPSWWISLQEMIAQLGGMLLLGIVVVVLAMVRAVYIHILKRYFGGPQVLDIVGKSEEIAAALGALREASRSDRAYVYLFHNGDKYSNGNEILRVTCAHESVGPGVSREQCHCQGTLLSTIPEAVEFLLRVDTKNPQVHVSYTRDLPNCYYKAVLESQGVHAVAKYPVFKGHDIVGFVGVDCLADEVMTERQTSAIIQRAHSIEILVNQVPRKRGLLSLLGSVWRAFAGTSR